MKVRKLCPVTEALQSLPTLFHETLFFFLVEHSASLQYVGKLERHSLMWMEWERGARQRGNDCDQPHHPTPKSLTHLLGHPLACAHQSAPVWLQRVQCGLRLMLTLFPTFRARAAWRSTLQPPPSWEVCMHAGGQSHSEFNQYAWGKLLLLFPIHVPPLFDSWQINLFLVRSTRANNTCQHFLICNWNSTTLQHHSTHQPPAKCQQCNGLGVWKNTHPTRHSTRHEIPMAKKPSRFIFSNIKENSHWGANKFKWRVYFKFKSFETFKEFWKLEKTRKPLFGGIENGLGMATISKTVTEDYNALDTLTT